MTERDRGRETQHEYANSLEGYVRQHDMTSSRAITALELQRQELIEKNETMQEELDQILQRVDQLKGAIASNDEVIADCNEAIEYEREAAVRFGSLAMRIVGRVGVAPEGDFRRSEVATPQTDTDTESPRLRLVREDDTSAMPVVTQERQPAPASDRHRAIGDFLQTASVPRQTRRTGKNIR